MSKHGTQIEVVWVDPPSFDPLRHGPPYLPEERRTATMKQANQGALMAKDYEGPYGILGAFLVCLRAATMVHQTHHWQTRGSNFYGDHLLFERLYDTTVAQIDQVAERAVGLGGVGLVDPVRQAKHLAWCIAQCYQGTKADEGPNGMMQISLQTEFKVLEVLKEALGELGNAGLLTDGTENLLQDIADKHEELVYLLKQRVGTAPYSYGR